MRKKHTQSSSTCVGGSTGVLTYAILNNAYMTLASNGSYGIGLSNKLNNNMKETKKTKFEITFQKTVVTEYYYTLLAESKEDALKKISDGGCSNDSEIISEEVVEVK